MTFYRKFFILILIATPIMSKGQWTPPEVPDSLLSSVAKDIWIPFMEAYRDYDAEKIMALHTDDIIRVSEKSGTIDTGRPYIEAFGGALSRWQEEGRVMRISFAIINTSYGAGWVSQRGYYKISAKEPGDEAIIPRGYSEFNVLLRYEDGRWKFAVDSDRRVEISEEEFQGTGLVYKLPEK
jgi:ketosteroid isomerase-like protein